MKVDAVDHINVFVKDLGVAVKRFSDILGTQFIGPFTVGRAQDKVAYDSLGFKIVAATSPTSRVTKYIDKHGEGVTAIGLKVPDIEEAIRELASKDIDILEREEKVGFLKTAVTDPANAYGVSFELTEYRGVRPVTIAGLQLRKVIQNIPWMSETPKSKIMVEAIDHIHIFVKDLEGTVKRFCDILGIPFLGPQLVVKTQNRTAFSFLGLEIMAGALPTSYVVKHIDEHGEGVANIALKVQDIEEAIVGLAANDIGIIRRGEVVGPLKTAHTDPKNAHGVGFELAEYKYVHPVVLAELQKGGQINIPWMY
jgi:methylmalonyl-CoA/ethylmalonyl-CoA epimerase